MNSTAAQQDHSRMHINSVWAEYTQPSFFGINNHLITNIHPTQPASGHSQVPRSQDHKVAADTHLSINRVQLPSTSIKVDSISSQQQK